MTSYAYVRDGQEIYRRSFSIIRAEADLSRLPLDAHAMVVRMIHACGMVDLAADVRCHPQLVAAARAALYHAKPIVVDAKMVADGIIRSRLSANNAVVCTIGDPGVSDLATRLKTTRSAAAVEHWLPHLDGAVVVVGNAPTALFRLLEVIGNDGPRPAAIIGTPVGFVGAAESKRALMEHRFSVPYVTVVGRRGGSAIAAAALNALSSSRE